MKKENLVFGYVLFNLRERRPINKLFLSSCLFAVCLFNFVLFFPISVNALTITVSNPFRYVEASVTYSATDREYYNNDQTGVFNRIVDATLSSPDGIHPLETYALQVTTIDIPTSDILHAWGYLQVYSSLPTGSSGYAYTGLVLPFSIDDIASYTYSITDPTVVGYRAQLFSGNTQILLSSSGTLTPGEYSLQIALVAPSWGGLPTFDFEVKAPESVTLVPEPSTMLLLCCSGLVGLIGFRRKFRK